MVIGCIVWLKLVSFAHTNYDLRSLAQTMKKVNFFFHILYYLEERNTK